MLAATEPVDVQAALGRPRLLVVEDERIVAMGLRKQLQALGYDVVALASSGEEAVLKAGELRPDLVLMDINLDGDMDGVEAAAAVRARFRTPVVFLTAYSTAEVLDRAKVTEPYGYILKPYEQRELHVVIETALYKHRMERKLEERERWFAATLRSIGDGVVATDGDGRVVYMNPVAERLSGWPQDEGVGTPIDEVLNLLDVKTLQKLENPLHLAMSGRLSVPLARDTVLVGRSGAAYPVDDCASPIVDGDGTLLGGVMVFRDVTERQDAARWWDGQVTLLDSFIKATPVGMAFVDADLSAARVNDALIRLTGQVPGTLTGKKLLDSLIQMAPALATTIMQVLCMGEPVLNSEVQCETAAYPGVPSRLVGSYYPVRTERGELLGVGIILTDVTERRRAEGGPKRAIARSE